MDLAAGEVSTGTTICAAVYDGGVVIGADSRVTTGTYIMNRASDKVTELTENAYLLRSGSAPDTQLVADYVRYFCEQHYAQMQKEIDVYTVANLAMQMGYQNKAQLTAAMICAGYDKHEGGQVYAIPIGGTMVRQHFAVDGSGSVFIHGYCDSEFKPNMTREECEEFVLTAVSLAISTDSSSGGLVRLTTCHAGGSERKFCPINQRDAGGPVTD